MWQLIAQGAMSGMMICNLIGCGSLTTEKFNGRGASKTSLHPSDSNRQQSEASQIESQSVVKAESSPDGLTSGGDPAADSSAGKGKDSDSSTKGDPGKGKVAAPQVPVEMVFLIDGSGSMGEGRRQEAAAATDIAIEQLLKLNADVVSKIFVIANESLRSVRDPRVVEVPWRVTGDSGLSLTAALALGLLRDAAGARVKADPNARKHVVMISDGDAADGIFSDELDAPGFARIWLANKLGPLSFHAVVGTDHRSSKHHDKCRIDEVGEEYLRVSGDRRFEGLVQDICAKPIGESVDSILKAIRKSLSP